MTLTTTEELMKILRDIAREGHSEADWALIESDDMFQTDHFTGGFDATEMAFCFSHRDSGGTEYWFQLTLDEVARIVRAGAGEIEIRPAG